MTDAHEGTRGNEALDYDAIIEATIKRCPKCGDKPVREGTWGREIVCNGCGMWSGEDFDSLEDATAWWNFQPRIDEYLDTILKQEQALAAQAAEHAEYKSAWLAMVREIANLDEVINPDDAMGQADDGDLLEHFDPWQTLREVRQHIAELEKQAAEHAAALKIAYGEGFSIALGRVRELESQLAECSEKLAGHVWAYSTDLEDDE